MTKRHGDSQNCVNDIGGGNAVNVYEIFDTAENKFYLDDGIKNYYDAVAHCRNKGGSGTLFGIDESILDGGPLEQGTIYFNQKYPNN